MNFLAGKTSVCWITNNVTFCSFVWYSSFNHICKCLDSTANRAIFSLLFQYFWRALYRYISAVNKALTQIHFNSTHFTNIARIFCLTHGLTCSWRNGDAQCCQLSNITDPFSNFFSLQKSAQTLFSFASAKSFFSSACTHVALCVWSVQRTTEKSSTFS